MPQNVSVCLDMTGGRKVWQSKTLSCYNASLTFMNFSLLKTLKAGNIQRLVSIKLSTRLNYFAGILYADGTAEETFDFAVIDSSVSLDVASSGTATVTVSILSDMESESEEEFYVYVEHNSYQTSTTATCTVVILDNDQPGNLPFCWLLCINFI